MQITIQTIILCITCDGLMEIVSNGNKSKDFIIIPFYITLTLETCKF